MALSIFDDKSNPPGDIDLESALKRSFALWNDLKNLIATRFPPLTCEWGFTSKSTGWGLRLKHKERIILYMTPCDGYFRASFALGEKAVQAARRSKLPASLMQVIDAAPKYAEGRGVRLKVASARDVRNIEKLAVIKMSS